MSKELKNSLLHDSFTTAVDDICNRLAKFPWENKKAYAMFMAQTYYFVRNTTSFISLAAARMGAKDRSRHYGMLEHLKEELNHDLLALADIEAMGFSLEDLPELPITSAFYQTQFYYIEHEHPISLYGYALCLEGAAARMGEKLFDQLKALYNPKCTRFLKLHAVVDKDHFDHGLEHFSDVTDVEAQFVLKNLKQSASLYKSILDEIERITNQKNLAA